MTLKKRIYFNNVRFVFITIVSLILVPLAIRVVLHLVMGTDFPERERPPKEQLPLNPVVVAFIFMVLFWAGIGIFNNLLTYRLIKNIVQPLESLSEGVRQVQEYNLSYRVDYKNDDEFRPVCDTFNQMTAYLEAAAIQQRKDEANRRELIAGISHDLRTPLTSIKGYLEGLEAGVASTPAMRDKYFATIKSKTADLEHIIEQLFLFSKLDMDEFPLTLRNAAIVPLVEDMIQESVAEYSSRGLDMYFSGMTDAPGELAGVVRQPAALSNKSIVSVDTMWLRNVIVNILENSITYKTKERARIEISAALYGGAIELRFADDGPGVNADALDKLFSAFYRSDPSRDKKGSGLGLAISAKIIERMGGSCRAELPSSGGLAIVISLPLAKDAAQ